LSQSYGSTCTDLWISSTGFISNSGEISNSFFDDTIVNQSTITNLTNTQTGRITGLGVNAISNFSLIVDLTNAGEISSDNSYSIYNATNSSIATLNNSGFITNSNGSGYGIMNFGSIGSLLNSNTISGSGAGMRSDSGDALATFNNQVGGSITGGQYGVELNMGEITNFTNDGSITGGSDGIFISSGTISSLNNSGAITGTARAASCLIESEGIPESDRF